MGQELSYGELLRALFYAGFTRIERDDRLLDIFPQEDREKGIELWEKWELATIHLLRVRLPFTAETLALYRLPRHEIETQLLQSNPAAALEDYEPVARGVDAADALQAG